MKKPKPQRRKEKLLKKRLKDKEIWGKLLGAALAAPIRHQLDYSGIFRKAVSVTPWPAGATPIYDSDVELTDEEKEELRIANKPW